jgi:hypothetical protein
VDYEGKNDEYGSKITEWDECVVKLQSYKNFVVKLEICSNVLISLMQTENLNDVVESIKLLVILYKCGIQQAKN